ncbi:hydantoinase/oxoprolinase family protein [Sphingopyxis indica]|uniref:hydantoinase/oxoprolinase family protein n=1 Tax=Sphingopyxis indica TaxID=436663 RepID=UPI002938E168|nr:hydantoinase/oxoprolinase family protein [Sphingopyxis indica]WOF43061.1 hydantoinase/oxoprolinase family protein [Sphingopyxis indica]
MAYIGTDIGGTFTDLILMKDDGSVRIFKALTTPENRTRGVLDAMELAAEATGVAPEQLVSELQYFSHGTTAATNAFIERKGARTGLLTTRGFEDTLRIQRAMAGWVGMPAHEISHFSIRKVPEPIIEPGDTIGVVERVDYKGDVIVPLDEAQARIAIQTLVDRGVEAIAISLLWSFRNPAHETRLAELIEEIAPGMFVTASSRLVPIIGEYERTSTTSINAYLGPVIHRYINGLESAVRDFGYNGPISIMESGGGVLPASEAAFQAANLLTSGPAGGVLASQKLGEQLGYRNVLTADMGGTSFDVGLIVDGQPLLETVREVGRFHVALPSIKVTAIGAGGGSIARVVDGHLTVGPESAGSTPGPACYGRGGVEPTITDADVVLGIIDAKYFLGGKMNLDVEAAREAVRKYVAEPLGLTIAEAAAGIREVANNQMADLLRSVTLRAGFDPRDFALMAYGGAGATHAHQYSEVAGIGTVIVPNTGPAHSAFGTVTGDRHRSFSQAFGQHAPARFKKASDHIDLSVLNRSFGILEQQAIDALGEKVEIHRFIGMRFRQQVHEIAVEVPEGEIDGAAVDALVDRFEVQYERIYGKNTALRISGVEFTALRVEGTSPVVKPQPQKVDGSGRSNRPIEQRDVYFYGSGFVHANIYRSEDIGPGFPIEGPCIIERPDTTIVVGPGQTAEMEPFGNIIITIPVAD